MVSCLVKNWKCMLILPCDHLGPEGSCASSLKEFALAPSYITDWLFATSPLSFCLEHATDKEISKTRESGGKDQGRRGGARRRSGGMAQWGGCGA